MIDINMGCPVPKVCKTGAGAALLAEPDRAVAIARAAARGQRAAGDGQAPDGAAPGDTSGVETARRLASTAASPDCASTRVTPLSATAVRPTTTLARALVEELPVPVMISGGLQTAEAARAPSSRPTPRACSWRGGRSVIRGCSSSCWAADAEPEPAEILAELDWVLERACEHLVRSAPTRYLRKFYPWYAEPAAAGTQVAPGRAPARGDGGGGAGAVYRRRLRRRVGPGVAS